MTPILISLTDHLSFLFELKISPGLPIASWMLLMRRGPIMVVAMHMIITDDKF